jgi:hypothetical protein
LSIDVEKMEAMKRLFAFKRGNRSDEATLSLLNVKFQSDNLTILLTSFKKSDDPTMSDQRIMIGRSLCRNFAHH